MKKIVLLNISVFLLSVFNMQAGDIAALTSGIEDKITFYRDFVSNQNSFIKEQEKRVAEELAAERAKTTLLKSQISEIQWKTEQTKNNHHLKMDVYKKGREAQNYEKFLIAEFKEAVLEAEAAVHNASQEPDPNEWVLIETPTVRERSYSTTALDVLDRKQQEIAENRIYQIKSTRLQKTKEPTSHEETSLLKRIKNYFIPPTPEIKIPLLATRDE